MFRDREEWWEFSRVQFAMTKRIDFNFLVPHVVIILIIASSADVRFLMYVQICRAIPLF